MIIRVSNTQYRVQSIESKVNKIYIHGSRVNSIWYTSLSSELQTINDNREYDKKINIQSQVNTKCEYAE